MLFVGIVFRSLVWKIQPITPLVIRHRRVRFIRQRGAFFCATVFLSLPAAYSVPQAFFFFFLSFFNINSERCWLCSVSSLNIFCCCCSFYRHRHCNCGGGGGSGGSGFFLAWENLERMFDHSFPASLFFSFFLKWRLARAHEYHSLRQDQSTVAQQSEPADHHAVAGHSVCRPNEPAIVQPGASYRPVYLQLWLAERSSTNWLASLRLPLRTVRTLSACPLAEFDGSNDFGESVSWQNLRIETFVEMSADVWIYYASRIFGHRVHLTES